MVQVECASAGWLKIARLNSSHNQKEFVVKLKRNPEMNRIECVLQLAYLSLDVTPRLQTCKFFGGVFDGLGRAKQLVLRDEGRVGGVHPRARRKRSITVQAARRRGRRP